MLKNITEQESIMRFLKTKCVYLVLLGFGTACVLRYLWRPEGSTEYRTQVTLHSSTPGAAHEQNAHAPSLLSVRDENKRIHRRDDLSVSGFNIHDVTLDFLDGYKNPCILEENAKPKRLINDAQYSNNEYYKLGGFRDLFKTIHPTVIRSDKGPCQKDQCRLRCFPYFIVFGVAESETMQLYDTIAKHPQVAPPIRRSLQYWDSFRFHGACLNDYMDLYDNATSAIDLDKRHLVISGEVNSIYTLTDPYWRNDSRNAGKVTPESVLVQDLYQLFPNMKFIIMLKDPVPHIYWHYNNAPYGRGKKSPEEFHERVVRTIQWWELCTKEHGLTARACASGNPPEMDIFEQRTNPWWPKSQYAGTIRDGFYDLYLRDLIKLYPRKNILILRSEDFSLKPNTVLNDVMKFLDLTSFSISPTDTSHTENIDYNPMLSSTRILLKDFFKQYNWTTNLLTNNKLKQ